ncbi:Gfo/Idh/MocA family protein [Rubrimonas cliftonensis]|uniref:Predicted dehydrogenase n=1 Tax=Rubrimonas cliftonensis TaxID=89524 RepID=A0A1H4CXL8_9RHOB|nr:Gfo/Idh/MocA family oxidoreductase [Rubrimonas cliftonensis]SEA65127.1 Predicted dehydrogenase [Rubrimonas cliftonensis]
MLTYGIIGYGKMGRTRHEAIQRTGAGAVKAIHGFERDAVEPALAVRGVRDILDDPAIDGVYVCCVNALNKPMTIEALEAGKHVFCEKPPAFNAAEVEEIRAVEARSGRALMYGFNHRHHGAAVKMRKTVEGGDFGAVLWMRGRYGKSVDENYFDSWRADPALAGGGILIDQGIHMVDLFLTLGGDFDEIQAMTSSLYWRLPGVEDNVFAIMRNTRSGCVASLHSTMTQWRHLFSLEVFMERGYMVLNGLKTSSGTYGAEQLVIARNRSVAPAATWRDEEVETFEADESWDREARIFADWIRTGRRSDLGGDSSDALRVMRIIDAIYAQERHEAPKLYSRLNAVEQV